jgi:hypothetical protein
MEVRSAAVAVPATETTAEDVEDSEAVVHEHTDAELDAGAHVQVGRTCAVTAVGVDVDVAVGRGEAPPLTAADWYMGGPGPVGPTVPPRTTYFRLPSFFLLRQYEPSP